MTVDLWSSLFNVCLIVPYDFRVIIITKNKIITLDKWKNCDDIFVPLGIILSTWSISPQKVFSLVATDPILHVE